MQKAHKIALAGTLVYAMANLLVGPAFAQTAPEIPKVAVRFAHEPYFDHTQSIIGLKQNWFKDVGITFEPDNKGIVVNAGDVSAVYSSGRVDVISGSAQIFIPTARALPPPKMFFYSDIFQGYALMAQPDGNYKSFQEFAAGGMGPNEAFKATIAQMRGKRFAFPTEAPIKGFINLSLQKGGVTLSDLQAIGAPDDSANVAMMEAKRADFQVGGVPSRITLQTAGFKPILTSGDLAAYAKPTADSTELRAVFQDGWLASEAWINANYDTVLRMVSVGFRINQYIADHPDDAAAIHTPFVNSVAGTSFKDAQAKIAYSGLDPFGTFDQQNGWIVDKSNPLNAGYVIGSAIKVYEEQGLLGPGELTWDKFTIVNKVYGDLLDYKSKTDVVLKQSEGKTLDPSAKALVDKAKIFYANFDYLDAYRFAKAASGG
jgi:ABC-type nitrate/sulfonate/bicarbonate transport system substrate-binding protein